MKSAPAGKHIVIGRSPERAQTLKSGLERLGADVTCITLIETQVITPNPRFKEAIRDISQFNGLVLTSTRAVEALQILLSTFEITTLASLPTAVVGSATASAWQELIGSKPECIGSGGAALLADELRAMGKLARRWLFPQSEHGRSEFIEAVAGAGGSVQVVPVYRIGVASVTVSLRAKLAQYPPHVICFFSPSGVSAWWENELESCFKFGSQALAIGTTTKAALDERGVSGHVAEKPDEDSIMSAVQKLMERSEA